MSKVPALEELMKAGTHFGHRTSRWHPKMEPYLFGIRGGIHIIDVAQTQELLSKALDKVEEITVRGGLVLFVGTKKHMQGIVEKSAIEAGMPFVTNRWLGGTFTNFAEIQKRVRRLLDLKDKREKGDLKKYTKYEQLQFDQEIKEMEFKLGGLSTMKQLPEAIVVFDVLHDKTAVQEARTRGVSIIGLVDSNVNPDYVDYIIPSNDDAVETVKLMTKLFAEAVRLGKAQAKNRATAAAEAKAKADVAVKVEAKETVEDLDDAMKEQIAKEVLEGKKK